MPEFIIMVTYRSGRTEHRCADDTRHARAIIGGLRGRYRSALINVYTVGVTGDVSADFAPKEA
jgi:hypothetical protein